METKYPDFLKVFEDLPDPRHHRTRRHRFVDILFIALCSVLTGGRSFMDMEELACDWEPWFKQLIPMTGGPPSHDTFNRVFQMMDPLLFESCFRAWTEQIRTELPETMEIIAVDGKCCRGSGSVAKKPIEVVNAWASENSLVLGVLATEGKGREIEAVQNLLKGLILKQSVVTGDALNCQRETAAVIVEGGGDYVLALKGNQPTMYQEFKLFLDELSQGALPDVETVDKGHGRIETRRYWQSEDLGWYADLDKWAGLRSVGMVHSVREMTDGKIEQECRYYISSLPYNPELFAKATRKHWGVENRVHYCLDVSFGEDQNRARTKYAAANLSTLRKMAMNILRQEPSNKSLIQKQRKAARSQRFLLNLLKLDA
jgi:predicted transposase YbfD/YdcC